MDANQVLTVILMSIRPKLAKEFKGGWCEETP
jgi:hypothetical protein